MNVRGSAVLRKLRQLEALPLRPETVQHLVFNPQATEQPLVGRLIASDPALAVAALRLLPRPFAQGRVGVAQLARAGTPGTWLDIARAGFTGGSGPVHALDRLWIHSLAMAHAARELSRADRCQHPETAYLAGLLHNLGLLAIAAVAPEAAADMLDAPGGAGQSLRFERQFLGTTHPAVGRQLARRWRLPQWLEAVIAWHHQPGGRLPDGYPHQGLVEIVHEADARLADTPFAMTRRDPPESWDLPWKASDPLAASLARGMRQSLSLLRDHPFPDSAGNGKLTAHLIDVVSENVRLRTEFGWRREAWAKLGKLPADAGPAELTGLVAEMIAGASGALAALCYVRSEDGESAEGTFWSEVARPISCALSVGGDSAPHPAQLIGELRPTWQKRPRRTVNLEAGGECVGHVLVWLDEPGVAGRDRALAEATQLAAEWLARAVHTERLETQLEALSAMLREEADLAAERLEAAKLAALAEMAAGAGHEINNPLAVISGRAQLLLAEETDPRRRRALETISTQAQRIHRMIVELMAFARPPVPDRKPLAAGEIVEHALGAVRAEAERRNITVGVTVPPDIPAVPGDLGQLASALECILRNSLEAIRQDGSIQVTVGPGPDGMVEICVADDGPGISPDQRAHIFEPFYSGREAGRGLGMGLSKAWRLVQNHRGETLVDSTPEGTRVRIRLPKLAGEGEQRACA